MCWILLAAAVAGIAEHSCGAVAATGMIGSGVGALEGAKRNAHQPIACDETKTLCDAVVHAHPAWLHTGQVSESFRREPATIFSYRPATVRSTNRRAILASVARHRRTPRPIRYLAQPRII